MNKLHVALSLLKLLNERKYVNSAVVAGELNVSIRTAQRYLCDLSSLPCVSHDEQKHTFCLVPDYPLNKVLLDCKGAVNAAPTWPVTSGALSSHMVVCKLCGANCEPLRGAGGYQGSNAAAEP